jgi:hypothetical protein
MIGFGNPDNIPGLALWWDAADFSTVNDGTVTQNQNVYKIVDKVSGVVLTNSQGVNGPTYAIAEVNGNNAIHMPYYATTDMGLKSLTGTTTQITSAQKTIVFVHRPTTILYTASAPVTKYALSIWASGRTPAAGVQPSIHLLSGSGNNPYSQIGEVQNGTNNKTINSWNYRSFEYGRNTSEQVDLNTTQIFLGRIKTGISKLNFYQDRGFDTKTDYYVNTSINTGAAVLPTSPVKIVIGSYWDTGTRFSGAHPMEGYFCELMIFNRYLTTAEINLIEQYVKMKWIS